MISTSPTFFRPFFFFCFSSPRQEHLVEHLLRSGAVLSEWGKELSLKTSYAKRLPLHYAAENKEMPLKLVEKILGFERKWETRNLWGVLEMVVGLNGEPLTKKMILGF